MFPPRLRRGTRHPDAPSLLASLRRASVRHPEGASGKHGAPAQTFSRQVADQTATALPRPAHKTPATTQQAKPRQPPPPQFARHGAHILNHRVSTATPAGPQRTPNTDTRGGAYILCRDIRVSELCEDGSPAGAKRIICTSHDKTVFQGERKNPADSKESAGFIVKCAPWDSNPEPID